MGSPCAGFPTELETNKSPTELETNKSPEKYTTGRETNNVQVGGSKLHLSEPLKDLALLTIPTKAAHAGDGRIPFHDFCRTRKQIF